MNITEFREQYPQYEDLSDDALADGLYKKYYADMPRDEFMSKFVPAKKPGFFGSAYDFIKSKIAGADSGGTVGLFPDVDQMDEPQGTFGRALRGGAAETAKGIGTIAKISGRELADPKGAFRSILAGKAGQWAGEKGGNALERAGSAIEEKFRPVAEEFASPAKFSGKNPVDNPDILSDPEWWKDSVGRGIPSMAASVFPAMAAGKTIYYGGKALSWTPQVISRLARLGAAITGGTVGGGLEGAGTYEQALKEGKSEPEARAASEQMAMVSAGLNALSIDKALGSKGSSLVGKLWNQLSKGLTEGATEWAEEPAEAAILGKDVLQGIKEGTAVLPSSILLGSLVPGSGNAGKRVSELPSPKPAADSAGVRAPVAAGPSISETVPEHRLDARLRNEFNKLVAEGKHEDAFNVAYKDRLTGVYNQNGWERVRDAGDVDNIPVAVTDATGFKYLNDTYGHDFGDAVLKEYAKSLEQHGVKVFRKGGDEFVSVHANDDPVALRDAMERAKLDLARKTFRAKDLKSGIMVDIKGVSLDYGIGTGPKQADEVFYAHRENLKQTGKRNAERGGRPFGLAESPVEVERADQESTVPAPREITSERPSLIPISPQDRELLTFMRSGIEAGAPGERGPMDYDNPDPSLRNKPAWTRKSTYPDWFSGLKRDEYLPLIDRAQRGEPLTDIQRQNLSGLMEAARPEYHRSLSQAEQAVPTLDLDQGDTVIKRRESDGELDTFRVLSNDGKTVRLKYGITEEHPVDFGETIPAIEVKKAEPGPEPEPLKLSAPEVIERKKGIPAQEGLDLATAGADLRAPERENKPVSMEELPLGRAANEAADREKQTGFDLMQEKLRTGGITDTKTTAEPDTARDIKEEGGSVELHSFPGPVGKMLRRVLGINDAGQMKWVERFFDRIGEQIDPDWKQQFAKFFRTPAFYVEEHPEVEPLFERNLSRSENNHRENRSIFDVDEENGYSGIGPILALKRAEMKDLSAILVRGDRDGARYSGEDLKQKFNASERVADAYNAARNMIERLQALIVEKRQEIALSPYETRPELHEKLSRVMSDLVEITDPKDRQKYMEKLTREQAGVLDHETRVALDRVARHIEGIHEDIARFEANPGYIPRVREEGAYHVRAYERIISPEERNKVFGAIMYGLKARAEYSPSTLRDKFGIEGAAVEVYKDALEEIKGNRMLSRDVQHGADYKKTVGKILDRLAVREVYMEPANSYGAAKRLRANVAGSPEKYFPENYKPGAKYEFPEPAQNKKMSEEVYADIGNPAAREAILERAVLRAEAKGAISVADAEAITDELLGAMNEEQLKRGAGKSFLHRSDSLIEGYKTEDLDKILTSHITGLVGYLNKALYSVRALRDMEGIEDPGVQRWANKYYKDSLKNAVKLDAWVARARGYAVFARLGGVVKTMVQNSFQQAQTGWGELARFAEDPGALLSTAEKDVISGHLTEFDKRVLEEGIESGQTDAKYMREISGAADKAPERGFSKLVDVSMKGFGYVETEMNRKPALLAAMRLFTGQKKPNGSYYGVGRNGKPYSMDFDTAMKKAKRFVRATHYEISRANEPEIVRDLGPFGRGLYIFQSYTANQLNWIFNRARHGEVQALGRFMLVTWALGGVAAVPFADEIDEWITKHYGVSLKHKLRVAIRDSLKYGRDLADLIMNGFPAWAFGVDMSKAVQLNTPLPIQILFGTDKSLEERASGAIGGLVVSGGRAMAAAGRGDWWKAAEYASPNVVGNILRAWRLYRKGATTMHGKPITDERGEQLKLTGPEAVGKALGFQSARMNRYQEANEAKWNIEQYWNKKRQDLLDRYRNARGKERDEVKLDMDEFNERLKEDKEARLLVQPITGISRINAIMQKPTMKSIKEKQFKEEMVK